MALAKSVLMHMVSHFSASVSGVLCQAPLYYCNRAKALLIGSQRAGPSILMSLHRNHTLSRYQYKEWPFPLLGIQRTENTNCW